MTPQRPIAVSGFMGAGKTTVGQRLARRLGWPFVDLDDEISAAFGHPIPQIFELYGEAEFRAMEARLLRQAVALPRRVVALGGGAVLDGASRDVLRERSRWVHLEVPPGELLRRLGPRDDSRPLWSAEKLLLRLAERGPAYAEAPEQVDGDAPPGDVVDSLMAGMSAGAPAEQSEPITLRRVPVNVPGAEDEVHIGWGLLRRLGSAGN